MRRIPAILTLVFAVVAPATPALARPAPPPPVTWYREVAFGGLGADPTGVQALTAATFPLPASVAGCGSLILPRRADDVVVRVQLFGRPAAELHLGRVRPQHAPGGRWLGVVSLNRRFVKLTVTFGRLHPSPGTRAAVASLLASL